MTIAPLFAPVACSLLLLACSCLSLDDDTPHVPRTVAGIAMGGSAYDAAEEGEDAPTHSVAPIEGLDVAEDGAPKITPAVAEQQESEHPELLASCTEARAIVIKKSARTLELRCGDELVRRYGSSLGFTPDGAKQAEGDGKTPEGEYFISKKFPSQYHRSLQVAYPNVADADAGLARGTITKAQHAAIKSAYDTCKEPPQTTKLGSLIQIHGGGGGAEVGDWTLGCVAVDNKEIEEVFAFQKLGCDARNRPLTVVRIVR